jgi:hypothetical protein
MSAMARAKRSEPPPGAECTTTSIVRVGSKAKAKYSWLAKINWSVNRILNIRIVASSAK